MKDGCGAHFTKVNMEQNTNMVSYYTMARSSVKVACEQTGPRRGQKKLYASEGSCRRAKLKNSESERGDPGGEPGRARQERELYFNGRTEKELEKSLDHKVNFC